MKIAVIDGQGGGIGKHITEKIRKELGTSIEIIALGTNSVATSMMLKAGANEGATGENAIIKTVEEVDVITGALSILVADSMLGELTPSMAVAVGSSKALKMLLPVGRNRLEIIGVHQEPLPHLIDILVNNLKKHREVGANV
jgi:NAD(P)-dependent dehydrogenase (short-subunit alcohol dehydrogenase family)